MCLKEGNKYSDVAAVGMSSPSLASGSLQGSSEDSKLDGKDAFVIMCGLNGYGVDSVSMILGRKVLRQSQRVSNAVAGVYFPATSHKSWRERRNLYNAQHTRQAAHC